MEKVIKPTVKAMKAEGMPYTGFLYAGLMIDNKGMTKVLEYNCRFGDPETQPIMMRLKSNLAQLCIAATQGNLDEVTAEWDERTCLGVVMASKGYPDSYRKGEIINLPEEETDSKIFHAGTKLDIHNIVSDGGRVLCATALGRDIKEAQVKAYSLINKVKWDGGYYRTDIGFKGI
jgi:phosphoribosylamine--glycine ligase